MTNGANSPLPSTRESPLPGPVADLAALARDLPAFEKPPVVEVAASLQFDPIESLHAMRLGLLWARYRDRYPVVEMQPPLGDAKEAFLGSGPFTLLVDRVSGNQQEFDRLTPEVLARLQGALAA